MPSTSGLVVTLSARTASPGMVVNARGKIPPVPPSNPVDAYILVRYPSGQIYSVMFDGAVMKGVFPCATGVRTLGNGWSGDLFSHRVCREAMEGIYTTGLILMPEGMPVSLCKAVTYDLKNVTIAKQL